jgi:tetratricopeptide (TPR) repeat protein
MSYFSKVFGFIFLASLLLTIPCFSDDEDFLLYSPPNDDEADKIINSTDMQKELKEGILKNHEKRRVDRIDDKIKKIKEDTDAQKLNSEASKHILNAMEFERNNDSLEKQIEEYNMAIQLDPNYSREYLYLAKCCYKSSKYDHAISNYSKAIELEPDYYLPYKERAIIYALKGLYSSALTDYNKVIELEPKETLIYDYYCYYNRGCIYGKFSKYDEALSDLSKAIENGEIVRSQIKGAVNSMGMYSGVISWNLEIYVIYYVRGWVYNKIGKTKEAINDLEKSIKLEPRCEKPYYYLGNIYCDLKKFKEALKNYSKLIEINPNLIKAYINRGLVYQQMGLKKHACPDFKKACELGNCENYNQAKASGDCE